MQFMASCLLGGGVANSVELCVCFPFSISCKENVSESFFR